MKKNYKINFALTFTGTKLQQKILCQKHIKCDVSFKPRG